MPDTGRSVSRFRLALNDLIKIRGRYQFPAQLFSRFGVGTFCQLFYDFIKLKCFQNFLIHIMEILSAHEDIGNWLFCPPISHEKYNTNHRITQAIFLLHKIEREIIMEEEYQLCWYSSDTQTEQSGVHGARPIRKRSKVESTVSA